ncbi:MAG: hypothetical protein ACI9DF_004554, partial [Verrucomicrobiales bacterium]
MKKASDRIADEFLVQRCRKLFSCLGVGFAQSRGGLAPGSLAVDKVA